MKKVFSLFCFLGLVSSSCFAQAKRINFELSNGSTITYTLEQTPRINYTETTVTVSYSGGSVEYRMSEIKKVTFGQNESTDISDVTILNSTGNVSSANGIFHFEGFPAGSPVSLIDITGKVIKSYKISTDGMLDLDTNSLPTGIYVIKATGTNYKFNKR